MKDKLEWLRGKFDTFLDPEGDKSKNILFYLFVFASAFFVVLWVIAFALFLGGWDPGTFGDFIGGTLNPILTFLTFMALLITIVLQQTELRDTRRELEKSASALNSQVAAIGQQNFEATFFQMLNYLNTLSSTLESHGHAPIRGRQVIVDMYNQLSRRYQESKRGDDDGKVMDAVEQIRAYSLSYCGHWLRYLLQVMQFLYEQEDTETFAKHVRAQLTETELAYLFYMGIGERGKTLRRLAEGFALFADLPDTILLNKAHRDMYYETSAYVDRAAYDKRIRQFQ